MKYKPRLHMTRKRKAVLDFITSFIAANGFSPSYAEIGKAMELTSLATVHKHVRNLIRMDLIVCTYNHARSIELTKRGKKAVNGAWCLQPPTEEGFFWVRMKQVSGEYFDPVVVRLAFSTFSHKWEVWFPGNNDGKHPSECSDLEWYSISLVQPT